MININCSDAFYVISIGYLISLTKLISCRVTSARPSPTGRRECSGTRPWRVTTRSWRSGGGHTGSGSSYPGGGWRTLCIPTRRCLNQDDAGGAARQRLVQCGLLAGEPRLQLGAGPGLRLPGDQLPAVLQGEGGPRALLRPATHHAQTAQVSTLHWCYDGDSQCIVKAIQWRLHQEVAGAVQHDQVEEGVHQIFTLFE